MKLEAPPFLKHNISMSEDAFAELITEIGFFAATAPDLPALQNFIVTLIPERLPHYNWTGFYMLDPDEPEMLVLGPFRGAPTTHVRIPVTEGICGAAVAQGETVIIDDVSADPRYLACSLETRSEIVVPIRMNEKIVGEIDIDSHDLSAFGEGDRSFLEACADIVGRFMAVPADDPRECQSRSCRTPTHTHQAEGIASGSRSSARQPRVSVRLARERLP